MAGIYSQNGEPANGHSEREEASSCVTTTGQGHKQAAFVPERANPSDLGEPALEPPVVLRRREELAFFSLVLIAWAVIANQQWFDRHFLPTFFLSRETYVRGEWLGRAAAAVLGASLALVIRPRAGRFIAHHATLTINIALAIVMAVGTSEMILSQLHRHASGAEPAGQEPRRRLDAQLGWTFVPARAARHKEPGRVMSIFSPTIFDRNMDDDRPHLGPGLVWTPAVQRWRLLEILRLVVRYRKPETIERGISVTRDVLRATCNLATARGAVPVIVVPQFTPEEPGERELRDRVLDGANLPVVRVELNGGWRIPGDGHPDARAAHAIAIAISTRLRPALARGSW